MRSTLSSGSRRGSRRVLGMLFLTIFLYRLCILWQCWTLPNNDGNRGSRCSCLEPGYPFSYLLSYLMTTYSCTTRTMMMRRNASCFKARVSYYYYLFTYYFCLQMNYIYEPMNFKPWWRPGTTMSSMHLFGSGTTPGDQPTAAGSEGEAWEGVEGLGVFFLSFFVFLFTDYTHRNQLNSY